jgi:hypothetical protein
MPKIRPAGREARRRLATRGRAQLGPYLEAIAGLSGAQVIEVELEEGETLRLVKTRVTRASRQLGKQVRCGETREGTLLVWAGERAPRRRPRRQPEPAPANPAAQAIP